MSAWSRRALFWVRAAWCWGLSERGFTGLGGAMACQHAAGGETGRGHAGERAGTGIRFGAAGGQTADGGRQLEDVGWTLGWLGTEAPGGGGGLLACHGIRLLSAGGYYTCTAQCCSLPVPSLSSLPCIGCVAFCLSVPVSSWVTAHTLRSIPCVLAGYLTRSPLVDCNRRKRVRVAVYLGV